MGATVRRPKMGVSPKKFGLARANGASIESAMLAAGYSPTTAKKGRQKLSRECLIAEQKAVAERAEELRRFGVMTPKQQEDLVRGRLAVNVTLGEDGGTQSAKLLGQDKRVNMFTPESMTGIIVLQEPAGFRDLKAVLERYTPPTIEGETVPSWQSNIDRELAEQAVYERLHNDTGWRHSAEGQLALADLHSKPEWKPRFAGCNPQCPVCYAAPVLEAK